MADLWKTITITSKLEVWSGDKNNTSSIKSFNSSKSMHSSAKKTILAVYFINQFQVKEVKEVVDLGDICSVKPLVSASLFVKFEVDTDQRFSW